MLKAFYDVFDRRRRPLRNHHFMVFPKAKLAYARIPGSPYQAIFPLLKWISEFDTADKVPSKAPSASPELWKGNIELLTARELKRRHPDFKIFTLVQAPHERTAASYDYLIRGEAPLPAFFEENRYRKGMSIDAFLDRTADISDLKADNLIRSQASMLSYRNKLVPNLVVDMSRLRHDWGRLISLVEAHCDRGGNKMPKLPALHETATTDAVRTSPLFNRIQDRYSADYRLFFPEHLTPAEQPAYEQSDKRSVDIDVQASHSKLA
jgi:hypothetical protein